MRGHNIVLSGIRIRLRAVAVVGHGVWSLFYRPNRRDLLREGKGPGKRDLGRRRAELQIAWMRISVAL